MSQENRKDQQVHIESLGLSHAHLELLGMMVMAWNVLRKEVVQMDKPRVTLNTYKTALQPASSRKCVNPKDDMIYDIIANMAVNMLTITRCMKMGSIGLLKRDLTKKLYTCRMKSSELPMTLTQSWDTRTPPPQDGVAWSHDLSDVLDIIRLVRPSLTTKWVQLKTDYILMFVGKYTD